jgi:acyl-CoA thioester hydrolase
MIPFCWQARVYWEDTDAGGIVYYANYLRFLERARTEWLRSRGISQSTLASEEGVVFSVVAVQAQYHRAARLDDRLRVSCEPQRQGGASIEFAQRIWREAESADPARPEELLLTASVRVACLDARTMKPRRLPAVVVGELP